MRSCEWCGTEIEEDAPRVKRFCGSGCRGRHSEWVKAGKPLQGALVPPKRRRRPPRPRAARAGVEIYLTDREAERVRKGRVPAAVIEKVKVALDRRSR